MYPKDTEKWKQFTTTLIKHYKCKTLFCIPKILKNESNSQRVIEDSTGQKCCFVSQRYWKMKAIHNAFINATNIRNVVLYPKDTEKWKQFTTSFVFGILKLLLFCIPKILKNESNSQLINELSLSIKGCFVSQRYWKMKAIHNRWNLTSLIGFVVLYPKDTEKWKQFTTVGDVTYIFAELFCIPKILKNESNSQLLL